MEFDGMATSALVTTILMLGIPVLYYYIVQIYDQINNF
jgi:hypothetical protein